MDQQQLVALLTQYQQTFPRRVQSFEDIVREAGGVNFNGDRFVYAMNKALNSGAGGGADPLTKALLVGAPGSYPTTGAGYADMTPLRLQNLDRTLTSVLYSRRNFVLWDFLQKTPTIQTLYEYDRLNAYGSGRGTGGFVEGGLPPVSLPNYERDQVTVRYVGVQRGVSQQARMVARSGGFMLDPVRQEVQNGTLVLLERITRALYFGDSAVKDDLGNTVNYDGIIPQVQANDPSSVIDLAGAAPTLDIFENAALTLFQLGFIQDFGNLRCFMSPQVLGDISKISMTVTNNQRQVLGGAAPAGGYELGLPVKGYNSNFGFIPFVPDIFLQEVQGNAPLFTSDPNAPSPVTGVTATAVNDATSTMAAGTYYFWVASVNPAGEAAAVAAASVVITSGQRADVTWNLPVVGYPGNGSPVQYRVYRTKLASPFSGGIWQDVNGGLVGHVVQPASGTTATFSDRNALIPGTGTMILMEGSRENIEVPTLTPLLKYTLPPIGTLEPFLLLLYHTIVVRAKKRLIIVKNIGRINP